MRRLFQSDNVKGIDGVGNTFLVNDHDNLRMQSNEIPVRHPQPSSVGQLEGERVEPVFEPASDLFQDHGAKVACQRNRFKSGFRLVSDGKRARNHFGRSLLLDRLSQPVDLMPDFIELF